MSVFLMILSIFLMIASFFIIYYNYSEDNSLGIILGTMLLIGGFTLGFVTISKENQAYQNEIYTMIGNGCEVYLNGVLIDIENVDINHYYITIKEDRILLTPKN